MTARDPVNASLRPQTGPNWASVRRNRDMLREVLRLLDNGVLDELERRCEQASDPDGYPRTSMGSGVQSSSSDTSVEAAALHGLPGPEGGEDDGGGPDPPDWPYVADWTLKLLDDVAEQMSQAAKLMTGKREGVWRKVLAVLHASDAWRPDRATVGFCQCCDRLVPNTPEDRLKNGSYCWRAKADPDGTPGNCYSAWRAYCERVEKAGGERSQMEFESERRRKLGLSPLPERRAPR